MRALVLLLLASPIWAAPAFVQASSGGQAGSQTTVATGATATTTGNTLLVFVETPSNCITGTGVPVITDTASDTFVAWASHNLNSNTSCQRGFIARNITGHATNVVTATHSGAQINLGITVAEISGAASVTPRDMTVYCNTDSSTDTSMPCGPFTTIYADEIVVIACYSTNVTATWAAASGYTIPSGATPALPFPWLTFQYKTYSATQSGITVTTTVNPGARAACWGMSLSGVNLVPGSGGNLGTVE